MMIPDPDIREVDRIEALCTVEGDEREIDAFLDRCVPGSTWTARIRTAEVRRPLLSRTPWARSPSGLHLRSLRLTRPVPVEPGLRFQIVADRRLGPRGEVPGPPLGGLIRVGP